ncbi:MAG: helix-turn-helix transcriptional regulator, partial [Ruminococcus sp.]|nr:helix-turn-helix transcriptional regulator [Ruminococcus sp.]
MYTEEQFELLEKVEVLQKERKLTQNGVAQVIGVSKTALSQARTGKLEKTQSFFDTLAAYFAIKEKAKLTYSELKY